MRADCTIFLLHKAFAMWQLLLMISLLTLSAAGAQETQLEEIDIKNWRDVDPEVSVKQYPNRTITEYRSNNQLYMVKVTPKRGAAYYLVDPDGGGSMEWRRNSVGMDIRVPQWTLLKWD